MKKIVIIFLCLSLLNVQAEPIQDDNLILVKPYRFVAKDLVIKGKLREDFYDSGALVLKKYTVVYFSISEYDQVTNIVKYQVKPIVGLNLKTYKFECLDCVIKLAPDQKINIAKNGAYVLAGTTAGLAGVSYVAMLTTASSLDSFAYFFLGSSLVLIAAPIMLGATVLHEVNKHKLDVDHIESLRLKFVGEA